MKHHGTGCLEKVTPSAKIGTDQQQVRQKKTRIESCANLSEVLLAYADLITTAPSAARARQT
jgi:hypothetical protein